jgi:hypothetical protein
MRRIASFTVLPVSILLIILLNACADKDYTLPVAGFGAAVKSADASYNEYSDVLNKAALEHNVATAMKNPGSVRIASGDCSKEGDSKRCRLVFRTPGQPDMPLVPDPVDSNINPLMSKIVAYAGNLESIAKANVDKEVKAALDAAKANTISLADHADTLNNIPHDSKESLKAKATAFADPVSSAVAWAAGKYVDHLKLEALRNATARTEEIFEGVTNLLGTIVIEGLDERRDKLVRDLQSAQKEFHAPPSTAAELDALRTASSALDAVLIADPKELFSALRESHRALAQALAQPEPSFGDLWTRLRNVAEEAEKLATIADGFEKAAQTVGAPKT